MLFLLFLKPLAAWRLSVRQIGCGASLNSKLRAQRASQGHKAVLVHAGHVLLNQRLDEQFHLLLLGQLVHQVMLQQPVGLEAIDGCRARAVELQHQVSLYQLVNACVIAESPCVIGITCQEVTAKGQIRLLVAQPVEQGGCDIGLLSNFGGITHGGQ